MSVTSEEQRPTPTVQAIPDDLADPASGLAPAGWRRRAEHRFEIDARYDSGDQPLVLAHAVRLAALAVAHEAYRVPRGHHCVFRSLSCAPAEPGPLALPPGTPITIGLDCLDPDLRRGQLVGAGFRGEVRTEDVLLGTGRVDFAFLSPAVYRFVRGTPEQAAPDAPPWTGSSAREFRPRPDQLTFRGAPVDHIPGMTLAEALLEMVRDQTDGARVTHFSSRFTGYTVPDTPCSLRLRPAGADGTRSYEVLAVQSGRAVCEGGVVVHGGP
ncbi:AfsA-related hotdog domain-containing protein [Streptomyces misionensis]|uniref:AfsA-related hotdog domain-containing protein n=1 Tax=Streptomyces misionensis TaxID=67331 RepID=UPI0036C14FBB